MLFCDYPLDMQFESITELSGVQRPLSQPPKASLTTRRKVLITSLSLGGAVVGVGGIVGLYKLVARPVYGGVHGVAVEPPPSPAAIKWTGSLIGYTFPGHIITITRSNSSGTLFLPPDGLSQNTLVKSSLLYTLFKKQRPCGGKQKGCVEQNGIYTYDRRLKFDAKRLRAIQQRRAAIEEQIIQ